MSIQLTWTSQSIPPARMPPTRSRLLQRSCACGGSSGSGDKCEECLQKETGLQRLAAAPARSNVAPPIVHDVLRSPGQPLDTATRQFMEPRFGHDFGRVRIHADAKAAESAKAVVAHAYTVGSDVVFGQSRYAPGTDSGRRLLAHELTHVVQQRFWKSDGALTIGPKGDAYERQADVIADGVNAVPELLSRDQSTQLDSGARRGYSNPPVAQRATDSGVDETVTPGASPRPAASSAASPTAPPSKPTCAALPSATPATCPGRHTGYHAAATCFTGNSWLRCVDRVSDCICTAVDAFNFRGVKGTMLEGCVMASGLSKAAVRDKAAWFESTNSCIWGHWRAATEPLNDPSRAVPGGLTPEWTAAIATCRASGARSADCCKAQVIAEQNAIDACAPYDSARFGPSPTDVPPGGGICSSIVGSLACGPPFTGDFSKVADRIAYGVKVCNCA